MCQILCLTSYNPAEKDTIIEKVWKSMSLTQKDGYGAAWMSPTGEIGFYKRRNPFVGVDNNNKVPFVKPKTIPNVDFRETHDVPADGGFLIIHGRGASPGIPIKVENTHPMIAENHALIHNGSVKSDKFFNEIDNCECDSELVLRAYMEGGVESVETYLDGWYAFMMLQYVPPTKEELEADPNVIGKKFLHIAKDQRSFLYCGMKDDGTYAMATNELLLNLVGVESEGEIYSYTNLIFSDANTYVMHSYKPVPPIDKFKLPKKAAATSPYPYNHWDSDKDGRIENAKKAAFGNNLYGERMIDKKYTEAEAAEIEDLEKAAINNYDSE